MPRIARAVIASYPHHIVQRGNNRKDVFFDDADRKKYLELLKKYSDKWKVSVLAYCLMTNHVHLLVNPSDGSLAKMMQGVTLCYTQSVNRKYGSTGRLWESRYHSCVIDKDAYLWAAARYIETNPVRAGMVGKAEDYPYSSARAHIAGGKDDVLGGELFDEAQRDDYLALIRSVPSRGDMDAMRRHTMTGRPFGRPGFLESVESLIGRTLSVRRPGRPKNIG